MPSPAKRRRTPGRLKKKRGRPVGTGLLSSALVKKIGKATSELVAEKHVRQELAIAGTTWTRWKARGKKEVAHRARGRPPRPDEQIYFDLVVILKKADSEGVRRQLKLIARRVERWQACAWLLERTHPNEFSRPGLDHKWITKMEKLLGIREQREIADRRAS